MAAFRPVRVRSVAGVISGSWEQRKKFAVRAAGMFEKGKRKVENMSKIQTTQRTSKFWKMTQAVGVLGIIGCVVYAMIAKSEPATAKAIIVGTLAASVWVFGRVGAWWCHE